MSIFSMANPGGGNLKPYGSKEKVDSLFTGPNDDLAQARGRSAVEMFLSGGASIQSVKVRIFDLSDDKQRNEYEVLWADLLARMSEGKVVVETHSDLVKHPDGTSYWMKYIEYIEFTTVDKIKKES